MNLWEVVIRKANKTDLPDLEWDGEFLHYRRLYQDIYQSTLGGKALMWVAELPGTGIIGQLFVQLQSLRSELADGNERAYIYGFRIKPAYRRQGLGKRMMLAVETDLRQRHFCCVTLNVARDNPQARRLYESIGYRIIGVDPGRWTYLDHLGKRQEVDEPAWRMEKEILPVSQCVNV
jgi:ribosomal protein S18 acetylase RimI-like enzyme